LGQLLPRCGSGSRTSLLPPAQSAPPSLPCRLLLPGSRGSARRSTPASCRPRCCAGRRPGGSSSLAAAAAAPAAADGSEALARLALPLFSFLPSGSLSELLPELLLLELELLELLEEELLLPLLELELLLLLLLLLLALSTGSLRAMTSSAGAQGARQRAERARAAARAAGSSSNRLARRRHAAESPWANLCPRTPAG
jgi:hypothetical protein